MGRLGRGWVIWKQSGLFILSHSVPRFLPVFPFSLSPVSHFYLDLSPVLWLSIVLSFTQSSVMGQRPVMVDRLVMAKPVKADGRYPSGDTMCVTPLGNPAKQGLIPQSCL